MKPPLLDLIQGLLWSLRKGQPVKDGLESILRQDGSLLGQQLAELWILRTTGQPVDANVRLKSPYQQAFWELIERSLIGQPITEPLAELEAEVIRVAQQELDTHIASLPFKALIPLLALQFPAFLIVLLGPLLRDLQMQLGH